MNEYKAKILSVYDADAVILDIDFWAHISMEKCCLLGINAPDVQGLERPHQSRSAQGEDIGQESHYQKPRVGI